MITSVAYRICVLPANIVTISCYHSETLAPCSDSAANSYDILLSTTTAFTLELPKFGVRHHSALRGQRRLWRLLGLNSSREFVQQRPACQGTATSYLDIMTIQEIIYMKHDLTLTSR